MALTSIKQVGQLDEGFVLAPERYDPRRATEFNGADEAADTGVKLGRLGFVVRETLLPQKADPGMRYIVLDTGDAKNGVIANTKQPGDKSSIGSAKKIIRSGDVLISRLRSYLRQVAWVDPGVTGYCNSEDLLVGVSTEFYVIRSATKESIAFLVPFLLSASVQQMLAAAQEGGHHPRFPEKALVNLMVPQDVIDARSQLSETIERAITAARSSDLEVMKATRLVQEIVAGRSRGV
jgi:hypothetical protein